MARDNPLLRSHCRVGSPGRWVHCSNYAAVIPSWSKDSRGPLPAGTIYKLHKLVPSQLEKQAHVASSSMAFPSLLSLLGQAES